MPFARFPASLCVVPLFAFSVHAQEPGGGQILPEGAVPSPVDLIQPVPAPEIPLGGVLIGSALPENLKIDNQGGKIEGNPEDGIRFGGPVKVTGDNGLEIFANRANLNLKVKSVTFEGNVSVYQGNILQRGDRAVYFYETQKLDASGLRISMDPILLEAGKFIGKSYGDRTIFVGENAGITTHDVEDPNYWVRSDRTTVYPGEKITFNNLKLYAGDTPFFWLPYLSQPLDSELGYHFIPGTRTNWGPFLLNTYGIMLGGERNPATGENEDAWLLSRWRLDLRARRGAAVGLDLIDTRKENREEISGLSLYYLYYLDPQDSRTDVPRIDVDENRFQIQLKYRKELDFSSDADWRFDTNLTFLSDQYYLEDFAPDIYRVNPAPENTLGLYRRDDESLLSLFGRFRVNDFYRTDTQSPEIAFDQVRRPLFGSPLQHQGQTSFSVRGVEAGDVIRRNIINPLLTLPAGDPQESSLLRQLNGYERAIVQNIRNLSPGDPRIPALRTQLLDTGFNRFHSNHSFSMPFTHGDWFSFSPHIGAAYTHYTSVQGPAETDARLMLHSGAEAAVKFSKDYGSGNDSLPGIRSLLHVIQPYTAWSVVAVDELDRDYPKIDRLTFTTRPRPMQTTSFTAIDEIESWNLFRLGVRNQLITRRDEQSHEWLFMDTYMDRYLEDSEGNLEWSNLYNDIRWQPLPWLGIDLETQFPVFGGGAGFHEYSTRLRYMPWQDMEASLAYRHLSNHPTLINSDRIDLGTYLRLAENWGIGSRHTFEMDDGIIEVQQYSLHRDLGNWVAGMGITRHDNRFEDELSVIFSLSLKDFPSAALPFKLDAE